MPDEVNPFVLPPPVVTPAEEPPPSPPEMTSPPEPPKAEVLPVKEVEDPDKEEKEKLLKDMQATLAEYGGEANVPHSHAYWGQCNAYRALLSKPKKVNA
jgi:hypothetical protein